MRNGRIVALHMQSARMRGGESCRSGLGIVLGNQDIAVCHVAVDEKKVAWNSNVTAGGFCTVP